MITALFDIGTRRLLVAGDVCVGNRYPANFDVLHVDDTLPFIAVADGMGSGPGSAVAGTTTMTTVVDVVRAGCDVVGPVLLRAAVAQAQDRVRAAGAQLGELTGCTLTALVADPPATQAWIVQIGDSRAYRLRGGLLELLTVDHTAAWLGAVYGWYPANSREAAAARYQLTRYVGAAKAREPDVLNVSLQPGDVYCLCTDGVAEQLSYDRLRERLGSGDDPAEIVQAMLFDTLEAGGHDNATVALLRVQ